MSRIVPLASTPAPKRGRSRRVRSRVKTAIGILLTAIMLFPVYWMINESFTTDQNIRKNPPNLVPIHGTLAGYRDVLSQQMPYLGTSVAVGLATVALTLVIAAPAGYALAQLRPRGGGTSMRWLLGPGDLVVMGGRSQHDWEHCVPKMALAGPRVSVTMRHSRPPADGRPES